MERVANIKVAVYLLCWFSYISWLYSAVYIATVDSWWGILSADYLDYGDEVLVNISASPIKIMLGTFIFGCGGLVLFLLFRKWR
ncbi:hypothetical protein [Sutcliffiella rhizosphaerae]|uniref:Uncharacterized protein n=1 Tax=Sutcliffiella rhizosphaerae TaxID=2880967 RepID=A0ABM8YUA2_9BACI|nr:hypothetical protein [Sutcliffiella rhizosphaerae]CAG9623568.1 hypothetical protein BACCIP111883_04386 [Sutcliffiella rhizosphaerae]